MVFIKKTCLSNSLPRREKCEAGIPPPLPPTHSLSSKRRGREQEWSFRPILSPFTSFRVWLLLPSNVTNVTSHQDMKVFLCKGVLCQREIATTTFSVCATMAAIHSPPSPFSLSFSFSKMFIAYWVSLPLTRGKDHLYLGVCEGGYYAQRFPRKNAQGNIYPPNGGKILTRLFCGVWEIMPSQIK